MTESKDDAMCKKKTHAKKNGNNWKLKRFAFTIEMFKENHLFFVLSRVEIITSYKHIQWKRIGQPNKIGYYSKWCVRLIYRLLIRERVKNGRFFFQKKGIRCSHGSHTKIEATCAKCMYRCLMIMIIHLWNPSFRQWSVLCSNRIRNDAQHITYYAEPTHTHNLAQPNKKSIF